MAGLWPPGWCKVGLGAFFRVCEDGCGEVAGCIRLKVVRGRAPGVFAARWGWEHRCACTKLGKQGWQVLQEATARLLKRIDQTQARKPLLPAMMLGRVASAVLWSALCWPSAQGCVVPVSSKE